MKRTEQDIINDAVLEANELKKIDRKIYDLAKAIETLQQELDSLKSKRNIQSSSIPRWQQDLFDKVDKAINEPNLTNLNKEEGGQEVIVMSRFGAKRVFSQRGIDKWEVSLGELEPCARNSYNQDGSLNSFDPTGGPAITVGTNLNKLVDNKLPSNIIKFIESIKSNRYLLTF